MAHEALPESVQTLYAELLEQTIQAAAMEASLGVVEGSFVSKQIKGRTYWYLQRSVGAHKRQSYLGPDSETLREWMHRAGQAREAVAPDRANRARLCSMLETGGAFAPPATIVKVMETLAQARIFLAGGVLIGTHAYGAIANMLGVRFDRRLMTTQDIDIAHEPTIGVALSNPDDRVDVNTMFADAGLTLLPIPALDPRHPSTSFMIRGRELRVDFLTPMPRRPTSEPIYLPAFKLSAQPVPFLGFLIRSAVQAVIVGGHGVLVQVPDPAHYALHKLWVSQQRPVAFRSKAAKDLSQASQLLEVLLDQRPGDLMVALQAAGSRARKSITAAARSLSTELCARLEETEGLMGS